MKNYFQKTWKNKIVSIILTMISYYPVIADNDGTAFVLVVILFGLPLFFAKENYID